MGVVPVLAVIKIIIVIIRTGTPVAGPPRTPSITMRQGEQLLERCPSRWIRCDSLNGYKGRVATAKEEKWEWDQEDLAVILGTSSHVIQRVVAVLILVPQCKLNTIRGIVKKGRFHINHPMLERPHLDRRRV